MCDEYQVKYERAVEMLHDIKARLHRQYGEPNCVELLTRLLDLIDELIPFDNELAATAHLLAVACWVGLDDWWAAWTYLCQAKAWDPAHWTPALEEYMAKTLERAEASLNMEEEEAKARVKKEEEEAEARVKKEEEEAEAIVNKEEEGAQVRIKKEEEQ